MNQTATASQGTAEPLVSQARVQDLALSEFLAFKLGDEAYGIDTLRVQEIRSFERPSRMAKAPGARVFIGHRQ